MLYKASEDYGGPKITGQLIVNDESEELLQCGRGWCLSQEEALARVHQQHVEMATLAANRVYNEQRMSPKAQAEAQAYDESKAGHVAAIPDTPIRKAGSSAKG